MYKAEDPKTKELVVLKKVLMEDEVEGVCAHSLGLAALGMGCANGRRVRA